MSIMIETIGDIGFNKERHVPKLKHWMKNGYIEAVSIFNYPKSYDPNYYKNRPIEDKFDYLLNQKFDTIYFNFNENKEDKIMFGQLMFHSKIYRYRFGLKEYLVLEDKALQNEIVNFSKWLKNELGGNKFLFTTDMWSDDINGDFTKVDYNTILKHCYKSRLNENID